MKVSIITVCLNSEKTIENTIQSVLFQSYKNIEYIVIDGNSTDNTKSILGKYADFITTLVSEPDKGLYDAMNKGLKLATGDVIGILNSDDLYKDLFVVEKVMKQFDEQVDAVYGDIVYVDKNDITRIVRYWHSGLFKRYKMKFGWMPPHPAFFVRRKIYERYGEFNTTFKNSADYELMLRLIYKHRITVVYLSEILVYMREGGQGNASIKNRLRANKEDRLAWSANGLKPPFMLRLLKPLRKLPQFILRMK